MWPISLHLHDDTRPTPDDHLAADEALLKQVDADPSRAALRLWESPTVAVIVGRSNVIDAEVDDAACHADGIPILRRCSGGGAVVIGPGCLCYSLVLPITEDHRRCGVPAVTADIMQRLADALSDDRHRIEVRGVSDLVLDGRKFSGNSQRWLRNALLHHGTVLYDFDLSRVARYLRFPSHQPDYRSDRPHAEFIANLAMPRADIAQRLITAWRAQEAQG
ncbi:MAG: lipoate--protein ligase family protein [Planctomycetaceae bacterium]|nr:lipoate--protein ligase family protein [Planctomycetaceae bacterium]